MKIRTTATNRRIRTAGAVMIAFAALTAACGGNAEVLDSAAETDADVAAETESAEETSSASESNGSDGNSSGQSSNAESSSNQSGNGQTSSGSNGGAPAPAPAPAPESQAPAPAPEQQVEPEAEEQPEVEPEQQVEPEQVEPEAEEQPGVEPEIDEQPEVEEQPEVAPEPAPAPEPVRQLLVDIEYTSAFGPINVEAELTGFVGDRYKGVESVCLVQYNEYGNPVYTGNSQAYTNLAGFVEINGVRYPDLIANGCRPYDDNFGEYTRDWSVEATRGINGNRKDYFDIAIRAEDGQVRVFCMNTSNVAAGFVERSMADFAGRSSIGRCPA